MRRTTDQSIKNKTQKINNQLTVMFLKQKCLKPSFKSTQRRSTTVSLEFYPLYSDFSPIGLVCFKTIHDSPQCEG